MKPPVIKTKDFLLRAPKLTDAADLVYFLNEPSVSRYMSRLPYPYFRKDALEFIKKSQRFTKGKTELAWIFLIEKDGRAVGSVGIRKIVFGHKAEIGYWLAKEYRGQGIMTKAVALASKLAFSKFKVRRLSAHVFLGNPASKNVLLKNGFKVEGITRKGLKKGNKFIDIYQLAKVK